VAKIPRAANTRYQSALADTRTVLLVGLGAVEELEVRIFFGTDFFFNLKVDSIRQNSFYVQGTVTYCDRGRYRDVGSRTITGGHTTSMSLDVVCMRIGNTERHPGTACTCVLSRPLERELCMGNGALRGGYLA